MKAPRSYSDAEIAHYVLGLTLPAEQERDLQDQLAHDDAAAARALKWEAYLLAIVDALPPSPPPPALEQRIRSSLGMNDDAPDRPLYARPESPPPASREAINAAVQTPRSQRASPPRRGFRFTLPSFSFPGRVRAKWIALLVAGLIAVFALLLIWANVRTPGTSVVSVPVDWGNLARK